jgi:hypothetical protein
MLTWNELEVQLKLKSVFAVHGTMMQIAVTPLPDIRGEVMMVIIKRPEQCPHVRRTKTKARTLRIPAGTHGRCCQKGWGHKGRHTYRTCGVLK